MILELLNSKFDQMVGYEDVLRSDSVDETIYQQYAAHSPEAKGTQLEASGGQGDQQNDCDTLVAHENKLIQWKKDKRKHQFKRRLQIMHNYENDIAENVNDFDKIGHGQQVVDHGPDYEATQNRALSMDCGN